jgi:DNA polymerase-3 subunit delta'
LSWLQDQGLPAATAQAALEAARGNPGQAAFWAAEGALDLRREVGEDLAAIGSGRASPVETAQQWLGDERAELRLRFAAELALDAASSRWRAPAEKAAGLTAPADFSRLSAWFDAVNRSREQLRAPLRNDLVLAGLLQEWRTMFEAGRPGGR